MGRLFYLAAPERPRFILNAPQVNRQLGELHNPTGERILFVALLPLCSKVICVFIFLLDLKFVEAMKLGFIIFVFLWSLEQCFAHTVGIKKFGDVIKFCISWKIEHLIGGMAMR